MFDMEGEMAGIFCNDLAKCNDMSDANDAVFVDADFFDESAIRTSHSKNNPKQARKAHMVPGGLNGGGKDLMTVCSSWVATLTEATAIDDARITAVATDHLVSGNSFLSNASSEQSLFLPTSASLSHPSLLGKSRCSHDDLDTALNIAKYSAITTKSAAAMLPNALPMAASFLAWSFHSLAVAKKLTVPPMYEAQRQPARRAVT